MGVGSSSEILDQDPSASEGRVDAAVRRGKRGKRVAKTRESQPDAAIPVDRDVMDRRMVAELTRVITAVAEGDLSQKVALEIGGTPVQGEFLSIGSTLNEMVDRLSEERHRRELDLERAMTARSRFYASMSHELRTPINAVLGYSTLLLERIYGPLSDKQVEGIERTQKAARHLLELVNDVLDLSKIEAGKIDLRLQPVEFPGLIDDLFVTVRPLADAHGSSLALTCEATPIKLVTDPRRVRQILLNLLSNAIKFGAGQPITVHCAPRADGGVVVDVTDQGAGIRQEDHERIFHEFVQLGKTQLQGGTGLGLPISRRLAELLDGSLTVHSTVGEGSTFRLSLPISTEARVARVSDQEVPTLRADERETSRPSLRAEAEPGMTV